MSALPTMPPATEIESSSVAPSPKRRRRVGGTSICETLKRRQFRCNQCDDVFYSLRDLETHIQKSRNLSKITFSQHSIHLRRAPSRIDIRPFECCLCGKAYYRKDHLTRHM
nr:zinc finger protein [Hymenolepis microstoma]